MDEKGTLRVRVRAAPDRGAANEALVRLLAAALGVPPSSVSIRRGATSRVKLVAIAGLTQAEVDARWPGYRQAAPDRG